MHLTEAEDIKKTWQEYTEELYKKDLHDQDNHNGVITHLEPDILECEVKWALGSITMNKASGGDGIPAEIFQLLKGDSIPCLWLCRSQQTGKFLKRWEYQTTLSASWKICMQVRKQHLEPDMEQRTDWKLGKGYVKVVYCHPAYLTYMQNTPSEMLGWMKLKLKLRLPGEISITSDMQMIPPLWQKAKRTKEPLDKGERGEWKSWFKTQH